MATGHLIPGGFEKKNKECPMCEGTGVSRYTEDFYYSPAENRQVPVEVPVSCEFCNGEGVVSLGFLRELKQQGWT